MPDVQHDEPDPKLEGDPQSEEPVVTDPDDQPEPEDDPQAKPNEISIAISLDEQVGTAHFATINGVQIFRAGTWNGEKYTVANIDAMIKAASELGYRPPVKLGHTQEPGAPAYGYAVNLRRDGDVMVADFEDVPDDLVTQIRDKRFDAVSSEIYLGLNRDKKKYPHALKAVAVLGAHPPAVANLRPLSEALAGLSESSDFVSIDFQPAQAPDPEIPIMTTNAADPNADALARLQQELATEKAARLAAEAKAEASGTNQLTIQRLQEQARASELALKQIHEQSRQDRIDRLVGSVDRPSWRGHIRALAELGTMGQEAGDEPVTVSFQASGSDAPSPTQALGVLEDLVRLLNADVADLYVEQVKGGNVTRKFAAGGVEDAGMQLFALTADYCKAHPGVTADEARRRVMADPKHASLVKRNNNPIVN